MWKRGEVFWQWADPSLHHRTHDETLENGVSIDVQVRLSTTGRPSCSSGSMRSTGSGCSKKHLSSVPESP